MKKNVFLFILPGVACAQRLWVYDPEIIDHVGQEPSLEDENVLEAMQVIQEQQNTVLLRLTVQMFIWGLIFILLIHQLSRITLWLETMQRKSRFAMVPHIHLITLHDAVASYKKAFNEDVWENIFYKNTMSFLTPFED